MSEHPAAPDQPATAVCSRKDCRNPAEWSLLWNNPRIHTPDRRKTWLACDDHRAYLAEFLNVRGLLRDTVPFGESDEAHGDR